MSVSAVPLHFTQRILKEITMDAKAFFQEVVLKNYQESKADQASFQKLWNAVVSMNTVPEYVALDRLRYASLPRKELDQKSDEVRQQYARLKSLNEEAITLKHVRRHISGKLVESSSGIKPTTGILGLTDPGSPFFLNESAPQPEPPRNEVWGVPWKSQIPFKGLAYTVGGRSLSGAAGRRG
jgi:hypothetical protein